VALGPGSFKRHYMHVFAESEFQIFSELYPILKPTTRQYYI
jgi:hypothetical protein